MDVKMNLRIITKNHAADPEKRFSHKIDFEALWPRNGHAASVGVNLNKKCEKIIRPLRIRKNNQNTADRLNRKKNKNFYLRQETF